ncbi:MAG: EFR1 family ferrodoxin [Coriobacteriales bacterium]|jgi:ferredoxin|nr:EFR1 family ferrodoxin [Coriobacteriales bacterium]
MERAVYYVARGNFIGKGRGLETARNSYAIYYFSATGNSLLVASALAHRLGAPEPISVPAALTLKDPYEAARTATKIGFMFPVHRATLPQMMSDFIEKMPANSEKYYFAVSTHTVYGCNEFWDIDELLSGKGAGLNFATSIRMKGCLGLRAPSETTVNNDIAKMQPQLDEIAEEIGNGQERYCRPAVKALKTLGDVYGLSRRKHLAFQTNADCQLCGTCVQVCPANNITFVSADTASAEVGASAAKTDLPLAKTDNISWNDIHAGTGALSSAGKNEADFFQRAVVSPQKLIPLRSDKCQACYACLHWCPHSAISTPRKLHNRYHNPQITPEQLNQVPSQVLVSEKACEEQSATA